MNFMAHTPTKILFGKGMLDSLGDQAFPGTKALLVSSKGGSAKSLGYLERTAAQLTRAGKKLAFFSEIEANPETASVMAGSKAARDAGCDLVVGLGGGSVIDAAKAIAFLATNPGDLWDYMIGGTGKGKAIANDPLPIIAVSTTAGTGSEVDQYGVVTNPATREKKGFGGIEGLFPAIAVIDPGLMSTVPRRFAAFQGFDALFHAIEGYLGKYANPISDMYALTAIEAIAGNLAASLDEGENSAARERVAFGSVLGGLVMATGSVTSQHSLEHALSAFHPRLPHGAGLIMLSEAYFSAAQSRSPNDGRFARIARAMGSDDEGKPEAFIARLRALKRKCGVDGLRMSEFGIGRDELVDVARNAIASMGELFACDRFPLSHDDCVSILERSYS